MVFRYTLSGKIRQKIQAIGDGRPFSGCDNALQRYVGDDGNRTANQNVGQITICPYTGCDYGANFRPS